MSHPGPTTGIPEIDEALRYGNPIPALEDYFRRRQADAGREAVITDLRRARDAMPEGSSAYDGFTDWLERVERGENPFG